MIRIEKHGNSICMTGHTNPRLCAAYSSVMYTSVNMLEKYDKSCFLFEDTNDKITIKLLRNDTIIDLVIDNMFDMFNDLHCEDNNSSYIFKED